MGSSMLTATIAVPADREQPPAFDEGRRMIKKIIDDGLFLFDDLESPLEEILEELIEDFDPNVHLDADGSPTLEIAKTASLQIIDALENALNSPETDTINVPGYLIHVSGGLSTGDAPTEAADAIWNAYYLSEIVLRAMGFIPDYSKPLSRTNGNLGHVTDTDVIDAIALGPGTKPKWSGADELVWIADTIGFVRPHPGDRGPRDYRKEFTERHDFDPVQDNFLTGYINRYNDAEDEN
ncbi:hypothetical protein [Arthrobacter bambusae]|uniref:Uncharacterized protein n=1 Tax=Arthrobacter bambusae TaxID=1338426 RepID=A0AAW8DCZ2_9MICC|nr:hypothetical protein [Arthrobacter bambusae]MDP9903160.1 hypothetical protein [Arthrobacter bambusae]MDQ0128846.1 hypothetical protein [Arthrobacter bambusae]MDQ0180187.1 hypothetical protein [Arthrobacter bambusae]